MSLSQHLIPLLAALACSAAALAGPVHEHRLDNGLKVLIKEDHRAPVVVSQIWYKVGSSYEHGGITGISHMLEHMMFKGTDAYGPGEFSRIVSAAGGSDNAFTGRDYTAYYQQLAADRLETAFRLESARMRGLVLDQDEFVREQAVVEEERRLRTEDNPTSVAYEQFMATAFHASPYQHPIIGWMSDIESYRLEDLRAWYERWYRPDNAVLVVVGDVQPAAVLELVREHFGDLPPGPDAALKPRREPDQLGERRAVVHRPANLPHLLLGYKVPAVGHAGESWEPYALEVLAAILDGGDSARLPARLVRGKELAAGVGASYDLYQRLPGLLTLSAVPTPDTSLADLESALRAQVRALQAEPVDAEELRRVQNQVVAADVYQRDSVFYQAMRLGRLETVGLDWSLHERYVERIRGVTPEQVQEVARRYLTPQRLTVTELRPESLAAASLEPEPPGAGSLAAAGGATRHAR